MPFNCPLLSSSIVQWEIISMNTITPIRQMVEFVSNFRQQSWQVGNIAIRDKEELSINITRHYPDRQQKAPRWSEAHTFITRQNCCFFHHYAIWHCQSCSSLLNEICEKARQYSQELHPKHLLYFVPFRYGRQSERTAKCKRISLFYGTGYVWSVNLQVPELNECFQVSVFANTDNDTSI